MCFRKPHALERWAEALHWHANGLVQRRQALDDLWNCGAVLEMKKGCLELPIIGCCGNCQFNKHCPSVLLKLPGLRSCQFKQLLYYIDDIQSVFRTTAWSINASPNQRIDRVITEGDVEVSQEKTHDIETSPASISPPVMTVDQEHPARHHRRRCTDNHLGYTSPEV
ncbi:hypothetical protein Tco_1482201 [Tanacetum coccineum]